MYQTIIKLLCPFTLEDYYNLTIRETYIIEHFFPKKNDTILDIGAHLGRFSIKSANQVSDKGKSRCSRGKPLYLKS